MGVIKYLKNNLEVVFLYLTNLIDGSTYGILIGVVSSIAVNLYTTDNLNQYIENAIYSAIGCVIFLIILLRIRQKIDESHFKRRNDDNSGPKGKWKQAAEFTYYPRVVVFFISITGAMVCIYLCIIFLGDYHYKKESKLSPLESFIYNERDIILKRDSTLSDSIKILNSKLAIPKIKGKKLTLK